MQPHYLVTFDLVQAEGGTPTAERRHSLCTVLCDVLAGCQTLSNQWAVHFDGSAETLRDRLRPLLAPNDRMVVSEIGGSVSHWWTLGDFSGWLNGSPRYRTIEEWHQLK